MSFTPLATPLSKQITLPHVSKNVNDLLLWRDPKKSGAVFGGITLAFLLFTLSGLSPLAILAYLLLLVVILALLWAQAGGFVSKQGPPVPAIFKTGVDDEQWKQVSAVAHGYANKALSVAGTILSGKDPKVSLQVGGALYSIAQVSSRVSILGTAYTLVALAFVLPKVYELKKDEIDKRLDFVVSKVKELYKKVDEAVLRKIPTAKKAA